MTQGSGRNSNSLSSIDQHRRIVVIDVETTGLYKSDRIVELSVITVDKSSMQPLDEYDTLINPERDIGATFIHGISATMVENAPTFQEIAPVLSRRLDGAILIGHNISFDVRFLKQEFDRLGESASFDPGLPVCTYRASGLSLEKAAKEYRLTRQPMHRALTDARMCAELAAQVIDTQVECSPAFCVATGDPNPRTLRRGAVDPTNIIKRKISPVDSPWNGNPSGMYRYVLNYVLDDGEIDHEEQAQLSDLAHELQLSAAQERAICRLQLASIIAAVERDGIVDQNDRKYMEKCARSMGLSNEPLPAMTDLPVDASLEVGMTVCFSGDAKGVHSSLSREYLEQLATLARIIPRPSVTKKLDLLVLADVKSASNKAKNARRYGTRILSAEQFLVEIGVTM